MSLAQKAAKVGEPNFLSRTQLQWKRPAPAEIDEAAGLHDSRRVPLSLTHGD